MRRGLDLVLVAGMCSKPDAKGMYINKNRARL